MRIVIEMKLPVIARLGGFHLLKSFLGCVDYIMKDSGMEDVIQLIHTGKTDQIMSGGSYYKALRAHFIVDDALCSHLFHSYFGKSELQNMELFITKCKEELLGSNYTIKVVQDFDEKFKRKLKDLVATGIIHCLWVTYHNLVT